jgi:hypothetical protein
MIEEALARRYPGDGYRVRLRDLMSQACRRHIERGLGDRNAEQRLCDPDDDVFWQQLSEVIFADQLMRIGLELHHAAAGPDFRLECDGQRIWAEVICPTPAGVPACRPPG